MSRRVAIVQRLLALITEVRGEELSATLRLAARIFLVMLAYYLLKPTREALILADGSAELRSYAVAAQAVVLLLALPLYSLVFRHRIGEALFVTVTLFFVSNLLLFYLLGLTGTAIGIVFFIWLGVFSVTQVAQFWALAADLHTVESGQRLFALIAVGGSLGAVVGSQVAKSLFVLLGPFNLMLLAVAILLAAILAGRGVYGEGRAHQRMTGGLREATGGIGRVLADPYLRLVALFVVLLNCINTTGEFILAKLVVEYVDSGLADPADKGALIGAFYADFFLWVNLLSLTFQLFLVSRLYRYIGVHGALLILPIIAAVGYAAVLLVPVFAVVRVIKILENSTDYSIQTTTRHALFLPLSLPAKYEGKTTIDTLFWRLGDLLQAGIVFAGTVWASFTVQQFAGVNLALSLVWVGVAFWIGRHYMARACLTPPTLDDNAAPVPSTTTRTEAPSS